MSKNNCPIGVLDSGVGGLTVARELFKLMPEEDIIYYGDTLHLPYGPKDLVVIRSYVEKIIQYLKDEKDVKAVVIACNTATSAALRYVQNKFSLPIFGMITSTAKKTVKLSSTKKIAVIGTEGTINSQAYQKAVKAVDPTVKVYAESCPDFVQLVEAGKFKGKEVTQTAKTYLLPLKNKNIDNLILGCTHFPYLRPVIKKIMGSEVKLIDPAHIMAEEVKIKLEEKNIAKCNKKSGKHKFFVSQHSQISEEFLEHGRKFLGLNQLDFKEENIFKR